MGWPIYTYIFENKLTVLATVDSADCRNRRSTGNDQLIRGASLVGGAGLGHHEVVEVQSAEVKINN